MESFKKFCAELIGTAVLVIISCGTAMTLGTSSVGRSGYILTALAYGLTYTGMFYWMGQVSGCHLNPAVSAGVFVAGEMSAGDFFGYIIAQAAGAFAGTEFLSLVWDLSGYTDITGNYFSSRSVTSGKAASFIIELVLAFAFVLVTTGVILRRDYHGGGGIAAGLTLSAASILGISFTNGAINPARSLASSLTALIGGDSAPISEVWIFVVAPILGGAIAAGFYRATERRSREI